MWEIRINREEIKEMMKQLDGRKAIGLDGVSGYILKGCRQEIDEPIYAIIECSLKKWIFTKMETRTCVID